MVAADADHAPPAAVPGSPKDIRTASEDARPVARPFSVPAGADSPEEWSTGKNLPAPAAACGSASWPGRTASVGLAGPSCCNDARSAPRSAPITKSSAHATGGRRGDASTKPACPLRAPGPRSSCASGCMAVPGRRPSTRAIPVLCCASIRRLRALPSQRTAASVTVGDLAKDAMNEPLNDAGCLRLDPRSRRVANRERCLCPSPQTRIAGNSRRVVVISVMRGG